MQPNGRRHERHTMTEILITLAIGLLAGLAGMFLWWALLSDWWHAGYKKRRCPKCAYDMTGTGGLKCPECGRTAKSERRLFRSRRRWKLATLALVALACASSGPIWVKVARDGWRSIFSPEQVALIQALRGKWEYDDPRSNWQLLATLTPTRRAGAGAASYLVADEFGSRATFGWCLRTAIRWHIPSHDLARDEFVALVEAVVDSDKSLRPDSPEVAFLQRVEDGHKAFLARNPGRTFPLTAEELRRQSFIDDVVSKGEDSVWRAWRDDATVRSFATEHLLLKRPPMTISVSDAVACLRDEKHRPLALTLMATLGHVDVIDAYWQKVLANPDHQSRLTDAIELLTYVNTPGLAGFRTRVGNWAAAEVGTHDTRIVDIARLSAVYPPLEPVFVDVLARMSTESLMIRLSPTLLDRHPARHAPGFFRALARVGKSTSDRDVLFRLLQSCPLSQADALELLRGADAEVRSATLQFLARRHLLVAHAEFEPLRPVVSRIASNESLSMEDRYYAMMILRDRTPDAERLAPVRAE